MSAFRRTGKMREAGRELASPRPLVFVLLLPARADVAVARHTVPRVTHSLLHVLPG